MDINFFMGRATGAIGFFATAYGTGRKPLANEFRGQDGEVTSLDPETWTVVSEADRVARESISHEANVVRAVYLSAWSALEHLLSESMVDLATHSPRALAEHAVRAVEAAQRRGTEAAGALQEMFVKAIEGEWNRSALVEHLVERAAKSFRRRIFREKLEYLKRTWRVKWPEKALERLADVCLTRNRAAHEASFHDPGQAIVYRDLSIVYLDGLRLAESVSLAMGKSLGLEVAGGEDWLTM